MANAVNFDYFAPAFRVNPYQFYAELREHDPVHWGIPFEPGLGGMWHIANYADILAILRDPRFVHQLPAADVAPVAPTSDAQIFHTLSSQSLLFIDPPAHTRLRALVGKAFTPRMVEALRPRVAAVATGLLDAAARAGTIDIINDYAAPLTIAIITEMLGVPLDTQDQLKRWAGIFVRAIDCKQSTEIYATASQATWEVISFFQEAIAARRQSPGDDVLSALIAAHDAQDRLTEQELIVTVTTLLIAGHETTVNLIGNGMLALLQSPAQLARLRHDPAFMPLAIEEFLRFDAPSQMTSRVPVVDVELHGKTLQRGQTINLLLGSANHDPAVFSDPASLDVGRQEQRHLAFGMGMHYCLGAPLARLEGVQAIALLLQRFPHLRLLDEQPQWRDTIGFRGLRQLPLALE